MAMVEKLSENLDLLMTRDRLTASKVASHTGIPASTIKKIRSRVITNPTLATLIPLANFFALSLEEIIYGNILLRPLEKFNVPSRKKVSELPIIKWPDVILWPNVNLDNVSVIASENNYSSKAFALNVEIENWRTFPKNSLLLIEPNIDPKHNDLVIAQSSDAEPTLKQFLHEDELIWLRSINATNNIIQLTNNHRILGVVIEYRKSLKTLLPDQDLKNC